MSNRSSLLLSDVTTHLKVLVERDLATSLQQLWLVTTSTSNNVKYSKKTFWSVHLSLRQDKRIPSHSTLKQKYEDQKRLVSNFVKRMRKYRIEGHTPVRHSILQIDIITLNS